MRRALVCVALLAIAAPARAAEPPDSATVLRLQAAADSAWRVRVTARRATYVMIAPRMDLAGITVSKQDDPPAIFAARDVRPVEKRVTWAEIERLDTERPAVGRSAARGAIVGAAIGGLAILTAGDSELGREPAIGIFAVALSTAFGAGLGALLGLGSGTPSQIYP